MRCIVWKNKTALLVVFCLLLCCCGCGQNKKETIHFFSMDTIMDITAYGDSGEALQLARDTIESLDAALNAADPQSSVSALKDGDVLPKMISEPLGTAQAIAAQTNGALDLTLYPLSDAWGFFTKEYRVPSAKEIRSLLQSRGSFTVRDGVYSCTDGTKLDLGSVAKGYAGDCAVQTLRENGVNSAILALGGNVQTLGTKPDGSDWVVSVADPLQPDETVCNLRVGETAVVTSGSYQRNFTHDGKTYHHILSPQTGMPAESGLLSVTVLCENGAMADGLSTALFVLGVQGIKELYERHVFSFDALIITEDRDVYITDGMTHRVEMTNESYAQPKLLK